MVEQRRPSIETKPDGTKIDPVTGLKVLGSKIVIDEKGCAKKLTYLKGQIGEFGKQINGWSGPETVIEETVLIAKKVFTVKEKDPKELIEKDLAKAA